MCPAGTDCSDKAVTPVDCVAGFYSIAGDMPCRVCIVCPLKILIDRICR